MSPAQHANALAAITRYVRCMRKHGIPMADPFSGPNGGVGMVLPKSVDPNSQQSRRPTLSATASFRTADSHVRRRGCDSRRDSLR